MLLLVIGQEINSLLILVHVIEILKVDRWRRQTLGQQRELD